MRRIALVLVACLWGCEGDYVNGMTPPSEPPALSGTAFPDLTIETGQVVDALDVRILFRSPFELTYTAASDDTTVVGVTIGESHRLMIRGVGAGTAEVSVTATEPPEASGDPFGPQGRSATRTAAVTVIEAAG
ncbi:MAG: hypothetical protein OXE73_12760 [Gammaproteobacteria bacterium]|nr:hypothetical protein [Gammaproteobacteria bacterium]